MKELNSGGNLVIQYSGCVEVGALGITVDGENILDYLLKIMEINAKDFETARFFGGVTISVNKRGNPVVLNDSLTEGTKNDAI